MVTALPFSIPAPESHVFRTAHRCAAARLLFVVLATLLLTSGPAAAQFSTQDIGGLEITPDSSTMIVAPNTNGHQIEFLARNGLLTTGSWSFSCAATGNVSCVSFPSGATYPSGGGGELLVTFNATAGGTGRITLTAAPGGETGSVIVDIAEPGAPAVTLQNHNRDNVDRSMCLTAGAGDGAAWSCGDLVITHAMPTYTTMNKGRNLTLIHNSATTHPMPPIAAVINQTGRTIMQGIRAQVWVGATPVLLRSVVYDPWSTGVGSSRQVVVDFNADTFSTGAYPMEFRVENVYPTLPPFITTVKDTLLIVNRTRSELGAGFGIAGVEQLFLNQPVGTALGHLMWVGGDGSAKLYRKLNATTWVGPLGGFQDTISFASSKYTRTMKGGTKVEFDATGRHTATINRAGQTTTFTWTSTPSGPRLTGIAVPPTTQGGSYTLVYETTGSRLLDLIRDPANRTLNVTMADGRPTILIDPDNLQTDFGWDVTNRRITSRKNRKGWTTRYEYSKGLAWGSRVTKVTFPIGRTVDTETAATVFEPWNDKGLGIAPTNQDAVVVAQVETRILGPRASVNDNADFLVNKWGAPTRVENAIGAVTAYARTNASFPALITRITHPNGRITDQTYNNRGNLSKVRDDVNPITGDPQTRVTVYEYPSSGLNRDYPTAVWDSLASPTRTEYVYNSMGLPDTVRSPGGHRTAFTYKTSGALKGLMIRSTEVSVETWEETATAQDTDFQWRNHERRFDYDAKGNLQADTSAVGAVTSFSRDAMGRVTNIYDPLKTRIERVYDPMDRVTQTKHYTTTTAHPIVTNPLAGCIANQAVCSDNTVAWDPLPNPVNTTYNHGAMNLESVLDHRSVPRTYVYDTRGLVIEEKDDYNKSRLAFYNEAGLITSSRSRTNREVRFYYDAAGRRTAMAYGAVPSPVPNSGASVPGDSIRYTYDNMDNLLTVTNREGTITRTYMRNGLVKQKTMDFVGTIPNDVVTYVYDRDGALRTATRASDVVTYNYQPATRNLSTMVVQLGAPASISRTFTFDWDSLGRTRRITYPTNASHPLTVDYRYDRAGILRRLVSKQTGAASTILNFTYRNVAVDPIGRIIRDSLTCSPSSAPGPCEGTTPIRVANSYSRMGALLRQEYRRGGSRQVDSMSYDASGNMKFRVQEDLGHIHTFTLDAGAHNRLASFVRSEVGNTSRVITYNLDGARLREVRSPWNDNAPEERYYHYDGLGRMSGTGEYLLVGSSWQFSDRETACQYDGDGQMIGPCDNGSHFLLFDGDNTTGTTDANSHGWRFFHAPGIDSPLLGYLRGSSNRLYLWVTDGMGREFAVADTLGRRNSSEDGISQLGDWRYAGGTKASNSFDADRFGSPQAPKLSFFRNRAYDQETGRWTQEDPIGLAGGVNLYQFNGNDPASYTDPFGLCVPWCTALIGAAVGGGGAAIATLAYNAMNDRPLGENVGRNALVGGAAGGAIGLGVGLFSGAGAAVATGAAPAVGKGTERLIGMLEQAGPSMDARIRAVSEYLPAGQKAVMTALEGGSRMLSGGAGSRATQVILNGDGSTIVKKFNTAKEAFEVVKEIRP